MRRQAIQGGLCYGSLPSIGFREMVELAGAYGFSSVMVLGTQCSGSAAANRRLLADNGVTRVALDGLLCMLPRTPAESVQPGVTIDGCFATAEQIGATVLGLPHYEGDPSTPIGEFVDLLGPICERAAGYGLSLSLEFMPRTGIPSIGAAWGIVQAVGAPNLGVTVDSWHLARTGGTVAQIEALPKGAIKDFHLSDRAIGQDTKPDTAEGRLLPGDGDQDIVGITRVVLANAPDMPLTIEVLSPEVQAVPARVAARKLAASVERMRGMIAGD